MDLDSPDLLKPLEHIAPLYSYSQVLTEPVSLPELPCRFNKAAAYCPHDDSSGTTTNSHRSLVFAMLILERIDSSNSTTEFIEARKEGGAISPALLQPIPLKLTGNPACLHTFHSNNTLASLPRESKRALGRRAAPLYKSKRAMLSVFIPALISQRHSSTKQMLYVGSAPQTLTLFSQALPSSHGLFLENLVDLYTLGIPAVKGHTLQSP